MPGWFPAIFRDLLGLFCCLFVICLPVYFTLPRYWFQSIIPRAVSQAQLPWANFQYHQNRPPFLRIKKGLVLHLHLHSLKPLLVASGFCRWELQQDSANRVKSIGKWCWLYTSIIDLLGALYMLLALGVINQMYHTIYHLKYPIIRFSVTNTKSSLVL